MQAEIEMKASSSSMILAYGYDTESQTLRIEFRRGGAVWDYDIPPATYERFDRAPSQGKVFLSDIKPYERERVS